MKRREGQRLNAYGWTILAFVWTLTVLCHALSNTNSNDGQTGQYKLMKQVIITSGPLDSDNPVIPNDQKDISTDTAKKDVITVKDKQSDSLDTVSNKTETTTEVKLKESVVSKDKQASSNTESKATVSSYEKIGHSSVSAPLIAREAKEKTSTKKGSKGKSVVLEATIVKSVHPTTTVKCLATSTGREGQQSSINEKEKAALLASGIPSCSEKSETKLSVKSSNSSVSECSGLSKATSQSVPSNPNTVLHACLILFTALYILFTVLIVSLCIIFTDTIKYSVGFFFLCLM